MLFTRRERVCFIKVSSATAPVTDPAVRFTSICVGSQIEGWVIRLGFIHSTALSPGMARLPVKWALLGSPAKRDESRTRWLAQPGQYEVRWVAGVTQTQERDKHVDSMAAVRGGSVTPSEDCFSSIFCDILSNLVLCVLFEAKNAFFRLSSSEEFFFFFDCSDFFYNLLRDMHTSALRL